MYKIDLWKTYRLSLSLSFISENHSLDISRRFINSDGASQERQLTDAVDTMMKINDCLAK